MFLEKRKNGYNAVVLLTAMTNMDIEKFIEENLETKRIGVKSTNGNARNWHVIDKVSGKSL